MLNSNERIIKHKVGLLNLAEELGNVSKACKVMGLSRDTFYRYKSAVDQGGVEALFDQSRRKRVCEPRPKTTCFTGSLNVIIRSSPPICKRMGNYRIEYKKNKRLFS